MKEEAFDGWLATRLKADAIRGVPEEVSALPAVNRRLASDRASRRLALLGAVLLVLAGVALAMATPVGAAVREVRLPFGMQQRFGLLLAGPTAFPHQPTPGAQTVPKIAIGGPIALDLTVDQAEQAAGHHIPVPSYLPPGVVFRGAAVTPDGTVLISYKSSTDSSGGMGLQIRPGVAEGGYVVPASAAHAVTINGQPGSYAKGTWDPGGTWHGGADAALLSWRDRSYTYVLTFSGLGLTEADLVRIASSVR